MSTNDAAERLRRLLHAAIQDDEEAYKADAVLNDALIYESSAGVDRGVLTDALYLAGFDMGGKPVMREDMDRLMAEYARLASEEGTDR